MSKFPIILRARLSFIPLETLLFFLLQSPRLLLRCVFLLSHQISPRRLPTPSLPLSFSPTCLPPFMSFPSSPNLTTSPVSSRSLLYPTTQHKASPSLTSQATSPFSLSLLSSSSRTSLSPSRLSFVFTFGLENRFYLPSEWISFPI